MSGRTAVLILVALALLASTYTADRCMGAVAGGIHGKVGFKDGPNATEPCRGASVLLLDGSGASVGSTTTDVSGEYEFDNVPAGSDYSMKIAPPASIRGEQDVRTGYKALTTSAFDISGSGPFTANVSLNYYIYRPPALAHPRVRILNVEGDPIEGAIVSVRIDGTLYMTTADDEGWSVFEDLTGDTFPPGSEFEASGNGYRSVEWTQGDPIPSLDRARKDDTVLVIGLILLTTLTAVILLILSYKGRKRLPERTLQTALRK